VRVDVCIITYRRPDGLQRLLGGIQQLELPDPSVDVRVVVVDNDAEESARAVCTDAAGWLRQPLRYLVEKRRGIPQARNTAVAAAMDGADFVAFIDDDEVPDACWLSELLRIQASCGADAVAGPCRPVFEEAPPRWIARGGFFERPRHATGTRIAYAYTHNVLVSTRALACMEPLFDEGMALTGSSDTEFFERFARQGHCIVWADGALVREWVPPTRTTLAWLLQRSFRVGTTTTLIDRSRRQPPVRACRVLLHGVWCGAKGGGLALLGLVRGRAGVTLGLRLVATGLGRLVGLTGYTYEEYRTSHGS
jgi:glycosyltransferase involved in cell wall biosynthesis